MLFNHIQILKDWQLVTTTMVITGITVFLLFMGTVVPQLRRAISLERDQEHGDGETVSLIQVDSTGL